MIPFTVLSFKIIWTVFGLIIGSFLGVVASRYTSSGSLFSLKKISGRSSCNDCGHVLKPQNLIPLFSFIFQGGRCSFCHIKLPLFYPAIELVTATFFYFSLDLFNFYNLSYKYFYHLPVNTFYLLILLWLIFGCFLIIMSFIDLRLRLIPDELVLGIFILGGISLFLGHTSFLGYYTGIIPTPNDPALRLLLGSVFGYLFLLAPYLITKGRGMGYGDVKLAAALGFVLGWPDILIALFTSFMLGGLFGIISLVFKFNRLKTAIPFGPFLALGAIITMFWGIKLLSQYFAIL